LGQLLSKDSSLSNEDGLLLLEGLLGLLSHLG
jgi:hypothetical protein